MNMIKIEKILFLHIIKKMPENKNLQAFNSIIKSSISIHAQ